MDMSNPDFWIELAIQISIMLLIFLVNLFAMATLVFKPTLRILKERHKRFSGMRKEAEYFIEQFETKLGEYNGLMEEAKHIARLAREDILKKAEAEKQEILTVARKAAEAQITEARKQLNSDVENARANLKHNVEELSSQMVAKILGKKAA